MKRYLFLRGIQFCIENVIFRQFPQKVLIIKIHVERHVTCIATLHDNLLRAETDRHCFSGLT